MRLDSLYLKIVRLLWNALVQLVQIFDWLIDDEYIYMWMYMSKYIWFSFLGVVIGCCQLAALCHWGKNPAGNRFPTTPSRTPIDCWYSQYRLRMRLGVRMSLLCGFIPQQVNQKTSAFLSPLLVYQHNRKQWPNFYFQRLETHIL